MKECKLLRNWETAGESVGKRGWSDWQRLWVVYLDSKSLVRVAIDGEESELQRIGSFVVRCLEG